MKPERVFCIDQTGVTIAMTPLYGRAPREERCKEAVPRNRGTITTIIGALTVNGLIATMTIEGGTSGDVFVAYLEQILLSHLQEGDIVVIDNLGAHKDKRVKALLASVGAVAYYLPPYSPEFNPIEWAWSKLKAILKKAKPRTVQALIEEVAKAEVQISAQDAQAWFRGCGFRLK